MHPCIFFLFNKSYVCVGFYYKFYVFFYYKFILIEKVIKHNKVNYLCCDVKYLYLHLSLNCSQHLIIMLVFYFVIVFFWPCS
jgi:hypothetical protein